MRTNPPVHGPTSHMNFWKVRGSHRRPTSFTGARVGLGAFGVATLSFVTLLALGGSPAFAATAPTLGAAAPYAVIAGSTITNTGSSVITGDVGLSPGSAITGFPPGTISGTTDAADATSLAAQNAATAAYLNVAGQTSTATVAGGILGTTYTPGVYTSGSSLALNGTVTLDAGGNSSAVFIFQAGSTLTTASGSSVVLTGGAQACNVFWQVGSSATLGTTTTFNGTILALASATLDTGATVNGGVFAQTGAVTLDGNTVTVPTCSAVPTTTTTVAPTTTTLKHTTTTHHATTTSTVVPIGAPATGEGGAAGSGLPKGLIGFSALAVALAAGSVALRSRRQRGRASSGGHTSGS